jgi:hypothetical protein
LKNKLERNSVLKFTHELGYHKLQFLDVDIEVKDNKIRTEVFTKNTSQGDCLNYLSECPEKYKRSVIFTLLNRAHKVSSDWQKFHDEVERLKQLFVNNNYPLKMIEDEIKKFLNKKITTPEKEDARVTHKLFYQNQMTSQYKQDEKVLQDIYRSKIKCNNDDEVLRLTIYYKNKKVRNLVMKNNLSNNEVPLKRSNVVYQINCPVKDCKLSNPYYIGSTQCTLAQRITQHNQSGAIRSHVIQDHNIAPERKHLEENAAILKQLPDKDRLMIYEALCIKFKRPSMNEQDDNMQRYAQLYRSEPHHETINVQHLPQPKAVLATRPKPASQHSYNTRQKND